MLVEPEVRTLLAPNPSPMTGPGTNTYLIGRGEVLVVDPGPDLAPHLTAIREATNGERIVAVLVTHGHPDHAPAAFALRDELDVAVLGHPSVPDIDRSLADGEVLSVGAAQFIVYHTPGHAEDHLCLWNPAERVLFTGDLIAGVGTVVLSDEPGALTRYLASLNRMLALGPSLLLPGHGPPVPDAEAKIQTYLAHRAMREEQILTALRSVPASVDTLVARLYPDTPAPLLPMAARNVHAHLEHLEGQGRVRRADGGWEMTGQ